MNYIKRLEAENAEQTAELDEMRSQLRSFKRELEGPKFTGVDTDGDRKDWIATGDVADRIDKILSFS